MARMPMLHDRDSFDKMIGRLDRVLSEIKVYVKAQQRLDDADIQTLIHHAEDMHGMAEHVLRRLDDKHEEKTPPTGLGITGQGEPDPYIRPTGGGSGGYFVHLDPGAERTFQVKVHGAVIDLKVVSTETSPPPRKSEAMHPEDAR